MMVKAIMVKAIMVKAIISPAQPYLSTQPKRPTTRAICRSPKYTLPKSIHHSELN
jgi:hypothetical protein